MRSPSRGGHQRLQLLLNKAFKPELTRAPLQQLAALSPELDRYTEVITAPGETMFGVMTRGEGPDFTARTGSLLRALSLPTAALDHHRSLATLLSHRHAFFKVEWAKASSGEWAPRASCYFRRRLNVGDALALRGVTGPLRESILDVAKTLGKRTPHFIAAAFTRDRPVEHKLYFSQYAEGPRRAAQLLAVDALLGRLRMTAPARELLRRMHPESLPPGDPTFFVSISWQEGKKALSPTLKLDYPDVRPARAAKWYPGGASLAAASLATRATKLAGLRALSYLGVRFEAGQDRVRLKYYFDLPALP